MYRRAGPAQRWPGLNGPEGWSDGRRGLEVAEQAVAALRDAISAGWADRDRLKEPDFDFFAKRADFQKLVVELEANVGPGAKQEDGSPRTAAGPVHEGPVKIRAHLTAPG